MAFTGQQLVDLARETLNDAAKERYTDTSLLLFANAGLGALALLRPDLFVVVDMAVAIVPGVAEQDLAAHDANALRLMWIYRISNGNAVEKCDLDSLARFFPGWAIADAGEPENWMFHPEDPKQESGTRYALSPPPITGTTLVAKYVKGPTRTAITLGAAVPNAPDGFMDALAHYIIFRAESKDDESVVDQRAAAAMLLFMQQIGLARDAKVFMNDGQPQ